MGTVYLLHFDRKYKHAGHYVGYTEDLGARIERHRSGNGARLIEVITQAGISFVVARTWQGDRALERRIKRYKSSPSLCPICNPQANNRMVTDQAGAPENLTNSVANAETPRGM